MSTVKADLYKLASQMVCGQSMPSEDVDQPWCKSTPIKERRRVLRMARYANEQARHWGIELKKIIDRLPTQTEGGK